MSEGLGPMAGTDSRRPSAQDVLDLDHNWYHTIELDDGRMTPGWVGPRLLRDVAGLPADLSGKRALDCGMFDGFWSFEMERLGAEVVGIDIADVPPSDVPLIHRARLEREAGDATTGAGFEIARRHLGSEVQRVICDVREVTPDRIGGPVDIAMIGALLLHIRDPLRALEAVRSCLRPDGMLILVEPVLRGRIGRAKEPVARFSALKGGWTYWYPNRRCLVHWVRTAGFTGVRFVGKGVQQDVTGNRQLLVGLHADNNTDHDT